MINQGVGVGPASAAFSASSTRRREPIKIGIVSGGQYY